SKASRHRGGLIIDRVATTSAERHASKRRAVCVGADVGGTWIRIAVWAEHRVATTVVPADRDLQQLASVLRTVWRRRRWSRRRVAALVVASRGLWTPAERRTLARELRGLAARVHVISDAQAALLGALGKRPGVLLLSGTGSIVVGRNSRGRWARAGGLGPVLGDEGSGFWLGREWLRSRVRDGHLLPTLRASRAPGGTDPPSRPWSPPPGWPRRWRARDASKARDHGVPAGAGRGDAPGRSRWTDRPAQRRGHLEVPAGARRRARAR